MGSKGMAATRHLRLRGKSQRGGKAKPDKALDHASAGDLQRYMQAYLSALAVRNYSPETIEGRRSSLESFIDWCQERALLRAESISKRILESYQRALHRYRKANGKPLGYSSQRGHMTALRDYFKWLCRNDHIPFNPASELELPRPEKRLPEEPLSIRQVEAVLSQPDLADPLGLRDRAILEILYSSGIRRSELTRLQLCDVNAERQTLQVRKGKGKKDRVVPIGCRALQWLQRYLDDVRPQLQLSLKESHLFLSSYGEAFNPDVLSRKVAQYIRQADIGRGGSCHLFRHTCATHMLENGADIRFIQQLLGHEKLETTQIYTEVSIRQLQEVHARTHPAKLK